MNSLGFMSFCLFFCLFFFCIISCCCVACVVIDAVVVAVAAFAVVLPSRLWLWLPCCCCCCCCCCAGVVVVACDRRGRVQRATLVARMCLRTGTPRRICACSDHALSSTPCPYWYVLLTYQYGRGGSPCARPLHDNHASLERGGRGLAEPDSYRTLLPPVDSGGN